MQAQCGIYLIPCHLGSTQTEVIPEYVKEQVKKLHLFFVEDVRSARRYLRSIGFTTNFDEVQLVSIGKDSSEQILRNEVKRIAEHKLCAGVLSEAGCAGIADPGAQLIALAHQYHVRVHPMVGPSSILLALIASGMNGQQFTFHGYLPIEQAAQNKKLKELELLCIRQGSTQIFMETPYRNNRLIDAILQVCNPELRLCIACDITLETEYIATQRIKDWKQQKPDIHKRPAVFLLNS